MFVCFRLYNAPTGLSELRIKTDPVESFDIACEIDPQPLHQVRLDLLVCPNINTGFSIEFNSV